MSGTRFLLLSLLVCGAPARVGAAEPEPPSLVVLSAASPALARLSGDLQHLTPGALVHLSRWPDGGVEVIALTVPLRRHYGAPDDRGVMVSRVDREAAGKSSGVRVGDVLLSLEGSPLSSEERFRALLRERRPAGRIAVELLRDGVRHRAELPLRDRSWPPRLADLPDELIRSFGSELPVRVLTSEGWNAARGEVQEALHLATRTIGDPRVRRQVEAWKGRVRQSEDELVRRVAELERRVAELERELGGKRP